MQHRSPKTRNTTIIDVAREAGVSYTTVSRVINGKDHIKPDKRERVRHAMDRLGYVVNQQARSLARGRSQVIGLLVPDLGSSYVGEIVRGIDQALQPVNYDVILYTTHRQLVKESAYVTSISQGLADGLILISPTDPEMYVSSLQARNFPFVLLDHTGSNLVDRSVGVTNWRGAYDATRYLIDLGHRRIAFINGRSDLPASAERLAAYQTALRDSGLCVEEALIWQGDYGQPSGYRSTMLLGLEKPPTAIFAANDLMAFGAMEAVREQGLRIGHDISVMGFDDIPQAAHVNPPLTTVRQPLLEMGRAAARMLLQHIADPSHPLTRIELETELVIRESCRPPATRRTA